MVVSRATRRSTGGAIGTGSFALSAKIHTATFCVRRISSNAMTRQRLTRETVSSHSPNPRTPRPGTWAGSRSHPMKARPVAPVTAARTVRVARARAGATCRNATGCAARGGAGQAVSVRTM